MAFLLAGSAWPSLAQEVRWSIRVEVAGQVRVLTAGLDPAATSGLDAALGEVQLPTDPAGFDARWRSMPERDVQLGRGSYVDIRPGTATTREERVHAMQVWRGGMPERVTLRYTLPETVRVRLIGLPDAGFHVVLAGSGQLALPPDVDLYTLVAQYGVIEAPNPAADSFRVEVRTGTARAIVRGGLHPTATDGLDAALREEELPPPPPGNALDVRFIGNGLGSGTQFDFRRGTATFRSTVTHTLAVQRPAGAEATLHLLLPRRVTARLTDTEEPSRLNETFATHQGTLLLPAATRRLTLSLTYGDEPLPNLAPEWTLSVYPNPVRDGLFWSLEGPDPGPVEVYLFNLYGQLLHRETRSVWTQGPHYLSLRDWPAGTYVMQVVGQGGTMERKIFRL